MWRGPGERDNVIAQHAQIAGELRALLAAYTARAAASPLAVSREVRAPKEFPHLASHTR